jgi:predicted nucleic acid-binding protein
MKYLLDTNTVSFAIRGVGGAGARLLVTDPAYVAVSSITEAARWFGAHKLGFLACVARSRRSLRR